MQSGTTVITSEDYSGISFEKTRVYTASVECLADPELYQRARELLPAQRRESADRMKVESGKRLSAGAGLLLMAALEDYLCDGKAEKETEDRHCRIRELSSLRFVVREKGKPFIPELLSVHFNLSHSGSRVMCIVSDREVGCDVEVINPRSVSKVIRCLSDSEQVIASESPENFFRIWTLKESILKLSGKGLEIPLRSFEVSLDPLAVRQSFFPGQVILKEYDEFRNKALPSGAPRSDAFQSDALLSGAPRSDALQSDALLSGAPRSDALQSDALQSDALTSDAGCGNAAEQYCCSCAIEGGNLPEKMIPVDLCEVIGE